MEVYLHLTVYDGKESGCSHSRTVQVPDDFTKDERKASAMCIGHTVRDEVTRMMELLTGD